MERVKRLVGNEIELDMKILTIESRTSNIPTDKGNYVCCHKRSIDKDFLEYVGSCHTVTRKVRGHIGIVPGPPEGFRGSIGRGHLSRRA